MKLEEYLAEERENLKDEMAEFSGSIHRSELYRLIEEQVDSSVLYYREIIDIFSNSPQLWSVEICHGNNLIDAIQFAIREETHNYLFDCVDELAEELNLKITD